MVGTLTWSFVWAVLSLISSELSRRNDNDNETTIDTENIAQRIMYHPTDGKTNTIVYSTDDGYVSGYIPAIATELHSNGIEEAGGDGMCEFGHITAKFTHLYIAHIKQWYWMLESWNKRKRKSFVYVYYRNKDCDSKPDIIVANQLKIN